MFYKKLLAKRIYINKISLKRNQGCKAKLKQTNLATAFQFQRLQEQRFKNWFDKVVNTVEHEK